MAAFSWRDRLWLWWHGYCAKHLLKKNSWVDCRSCDSQGPRHGKKCIECCKGAKTRAKVVENASKQAIAREIERLKKKVGVTW